MQRSLDANCVVGNMAVPSQVLTPHKLRRRMKNQSAAIDALERDWSDNPRWRGVTRDYGAAAVVRLRGSVQIEHTLARRGAESYGVASTLKILYRHSAR